MGGKHMYLMKVIMMGDKEVIDPSLFMKFHGTLAEYPKGSPLKEIVLISLREEKIQNKTMKFQLWEFISKIELETQRSVFFLGSLGGIMVFDVTNKTTFEKSIRQIKEIWSKIGKPIPIALIGLNPSQKRKKLSEEIKNDISDQIERLNIELRSYNHEIYYSETKELTDLEIGSIFDYLGKCYIKNLI